MSFTYEDLLLLISQNDDLEEDERCWLISNIRNINRHYVEKFGKTFVSESRIKALEDAISAIKNKPALYNKAGYNI